MFIFKNGQGNAASRPGKRSILLFGLGFFFLLAAVPGFLLSQETDPFYLKWLESGEAAYFARDYRQAVSYLEIAVFGLARDKDLQARGYVFLALSRTALGFKGQAAVDLSAADGLVGRDGLRSMNLPEAVRTRLDALLSSVPVSKAPPATPAAPPSEALPAGDRTEATPLPPAETPSAGDLRREMEANPREPDSYYELSRLSRRAGKTGEAREILETLLDRNPAEIRAYLEIGRLDYEKDDFKAAMKALEKFLSLSAGVFVEERFRDEGRALLLLSASRRGEAKKTARLLEESEDLFRPERFAKLTLDPADLERLRRLRRTPAG
ncbi:MAG TPA: hypothetical protein PLQ86_05105 [Candidatus Aminicenantes bacterium]|nr:hypothetical protein [Candidatus Aminicenantes bacterium]HQH45325.1 hypothetical protein [Candidatus Aminicenantes bacterium]